MKTLFTALMQVKLFQKLLNLLKENPSITQRQIHNFFNIGLGRTNYCPKAQSLGEVGYFSTNPNKHIYMHHLTLSGMSEKLSLNIHFLKCKQEDCDELREEIDQLQTEITQNRTRAKAASEVINTSSTKQSHTNSILDLMGKPTILPQHSTTQQT
jgi:hypothetical protein